MRPNKKRLRETSIFYPKKKNGQEFVMKKKKKMKL